MAEWRTINFEETKDETARKVVNDVLVDFCKDPNNKGFELNEQKDQKDWIGIYASNTFLMFGNDEHDGDIIVNRIQEKLKALNSDAEVLFTYSYAHNPEFDGRITKDDADMIAKYEPDYDDCDEVGCSYKRVPIIEEPDIGLDDLDM